MKSINDIETTKDTLAGLAPQDISRRNVLRGLFFGLGAASLPDWALRQARAQAGGGLELQIPFGPLGAQDFGPLELKTVADHLPSVNHQLYAPIGFDVRVVMRFGVNPITLDTTGTLGHSKPDGGAVFTTDDGGWIYTSNSEINPNGSVSALRFASDGTLVDYYRICTATRQNCAGGKTPWNTWITCEEVTGGFAYECDPFGVAGQRQLTALGARNGREAVAIDPIHHVCYQTLDSSSGKFVRFVSDPSDLTLTPAGITRMQMVAGVSQRLYIPPYGALPGFNNVTVANTAAASAELRQARPIEWVEDAGANGTNFNGGEGIWYYEIPEPLRHVPTAGTVETRGVIFFASKNDNRIWAIDIENSLIELIYDTHNNQAFPNLRNSDAAASNFSQVDNVVVSPLGDVLVAEDGTAMRLAVMFNGQPAKLLVQITRGGSEIAGPAFTDDGSRLYFSSQSGPGGVDGSSANGVIYEMTIPPQFRAIQVAAPFSFEEQLNVPVGGTVTSEPVLLEGFHGQLTGSVSAGGELSVDGGEWTTGPVTVVAGQSVSVRHTSATSAGTATETTLTVALPSGSNPTRAVFRSVTPQALPTPVPGITAAVIGVGVAALGARELTSNRKTSPEPSEPKP